MPGESTHVRALLRTALLLASASVVAQESADGIVAERHALPALTPVDLFIEETISSNVNENGDRFRLRVAEDVRVGDVVVVPAGSRGEGQVVHAARSRGGGKAGELILAARFVTVGEREIKLRSLAAGSGKDRTNAAVGIAATLGFPALLVRGGEFVIPAGTLAHAKTAEDLLLPSAGRATTAVSVPIQSTEEP